MTPARRLQSGLRGLAQMSKEKTQIEQIFLQKACLELENLVEGKNLLTANEPLLHMRIQALLTELRLRQLNK